MIDICAATFVRYLLLFSVRYLQLSCAALSWATDDTMEKTQEILRHLQFIRYIPEITKADANNERKIMRN